MRTSDSLFNFEANSKIIGDYCYALNYYLNNKTEY